MLNSEEEESEHSDNKKVAGQSVHFITPLYNIVTDCIILLKGRRDSVMLKRILIVLCILSVGLIGYSKPTLNVGFTGSVVQGYNSFFNDESIGTYFVFENGIHRYYSQAVLDTGANTTIIPEWLADSLHLENDGTQVMGGIGGITSSSYRSKIGIVINGEHFKNVDCVVVPDFQYILIGASFFRNNHMKVTFDYSSNKIQFQDTKKSGK